MSNPDTRHDDGAVADPHVVPNLDARFAPFLAKALVELGAKEIFVGAIGDLVLRDAIKCVSALRRTSEAMAENLPMTV
jgi:glycine/D-amino acid oxidase-like deaminating enzyme